MENVVIRKLVASASKLLALVALMFVSTASVFWVYRPKTPTELRKR